MPEAVDCIPTELTERIERKKRIKESMKEVEREVKCTTGKGDRNGNPGIELRSFRERRIGD